MQCTDLSEIHSWGQRSARRTVLRAFSWLGASVVMLDTCARTRFKRESPLQWDRGSDPPCNLDAGHRWVKNSVWRLTIARKDMTSCVGEESLHIRL